jgi:hypothetical protein
LESISSMPPLPDGGTNSSNRSSSFIPPSQAHEVDDGWDGGR